MRVFLNTLRGVTDSSAAAIQRGPVGPFVYVVNDGKVTQTNVSLGLQNEAIAVIAKGVEAGAVVVTSGFGRLSDEATVTVTMQDETNPAPAAEEQPNNNNRRRGRRG